MHPQPRIHLLTTEDLLCIAQQGAPIGIPPELIQIQDDDRVVFTMRGIQFYKYALAQYGLDVELHKVTCAADVHRIHKELAAAAYCRQVAQLDHGLIGRLSDGYTRTHVSNKVKGALEAIRHAAAALQLA